MVKVVLGDMSFKLPAHTWQKLIEMGFNILIDDREEHAEDKYFYGEMDDEIFRTDPRLVKLVEELIVSGEIKTGSRHPTEPDINDEYHGDRLNIIEVPDDVDFHIHDGECGGGEYVEECHRIWSADSPQGHSWCKQWGSYKHPRLRGEPLGE